MGRSLSYFSFLYTTIFIFSKLGDQGQTIRQLMNAHMIRRVVMCCLSSGKRQHLAVAHEKGKLTVLQLSALLKQADSSQKKLTLTRLVYISSKIKIPYHSSLSYLGTLPQECLGWVDCL